MRGRSNNKSGAATRTELRSSSNGRGRDLGRIQSLGENLAINERDLHLPGECACVVGERSRTHHVATRNLLRRDYTSQLPYRSDAHPPVSPVLALNEVGPTTLSQDDIHTAVGTCAGRLRGETTPSERLGDEVLKLSPGECANRVNARLPIVQSSLLAAPEKPKEDSHGTASTKHIPQNRHRRNDHSANLPGDDQGQSTYRPAPIARATYHGTIAQTSDSPPMRLLRVIDISCTFSRITVGPRDAGSSSHFSVESRFPGPGSSETTVGP
jgi:hypothetical protein